MLHDAIASCNGGSNRQKMKKILIIILLLIINYGLLVFPVCAQTPTPSPRPTFGPTCSPSPQPTLTPVPPTATPTAPVSGISTATFLTMTSGLLLAFLGLSLFSFKAKWSDDLPDGR